MRRLPRLTPHLLIAVISLIITIRTPLVAAAPDAVTCDKLKITLSDDKNFYVFTATASGNASTITGYRFDFGDHQSYNFTFSPSDAQDRHTATATHTYLDPGNYTPTVHLDTQVNKKNTTVTSPDCQTSVSIGNSPGTLPNAGARGTIGIFISVSLLGITLHQTWLRRFQKKI
jgi:hypothetical protein